MVAVHFLRIIQVGQQPFRFLRLVTTLPQPHDEFSLPQDLLLARKHMPLGHLQIGLVHPHEGCT